jgi:hypothetical protein
MIGSEADCSMLNLGDEVSVSVDRNTVDNFLDEEPPLL